MRIEKDIKPKLDRKTGYKELINLLSKDKIIIKREG